MIVSSNRRAMPHIEFAGARITRGQGAVVTDFRPAVAA